MKKITLISGNPKKAAQVQQYVEVDIDHQSVDIDEIQSLDPYEVIEHKAKAAFEVLNGPVLVEDTSLVFHALGQLPGTFIKFFVESIGPEGLSRLLKDYDDRSATNTIIFALYDGGEMNYFEASTPGSIATEPRGERGMAFDSIFIPQGYEQTRSEMSQEDFDESNTRRKALVKFHEFMKEK